MVLYDTMNNQTKLQLEYNLAHYALKKARSEKSLGSSIIMKKLLIFNPKIGEKMNILQK